MKGFWSFAFTFVAFFVLAYVFLAWLDMLPEPIPSSSPEVALTESPNTGVTVEMAAAEYPTRVVVKKAGIDVTIANPETTDVEELDAELLKGAVRYPTSAMLGVEGTVLLFGHSSYLPIVHNKNFKAFNGIQNLKEGDTISVYSEGYEYRYTVNGVRLADATEDKVELPASGKHLAMVTCDSFGTKSDRWVLTADLEGIYER